MGKRMRIKKVAIRPSLARSTGPLFEAVPPPSQDDYNSDFASDDGPPAEKDEVPTLQAHDGASNGLHVRSRTPMETLIDEVEDYASQQEPQSNNATVNSYRHRVHNFGSLSMLPVWDSKTGEAVVPLVDGSGHERARRRAREERSLVQRKEIGIEADREQTGTYTSPHGSVIRLTTGGDSWGKQQRLRMMHEQEGMEGTSRIAPSRGKPRNAFRDSQIRMMKLTRWTSQSNDAKALSKRRSQPDATLL